MQDLIKTNEIEKDYFNDLKKIKESIRLNQNKAMVQVNSYMIKTYYEIGTIINKRKIWGNKYIERLSNDLKEYGKGYSIQNLYRMSQIANEYSFNELFSQPAREIPWFTLIEITHKSNTHEEMLYYINETFKNGWSRSMVLNQIAMKRYERSLIEPITSPVVKSNDSINELFKDTYVFDYVDKEKINNEKDLKNQMVDNIIKFLQELGPWFCLVGKEYKLATPSNEEFYIDLLMYHIRIHSFVVIEVKIGKFNPSDLGQLLFYVGAVDDLIKGEGDNDTIGLLLCKDADSYTAKTTLNKVNAKLGISKYKFVDEITEYLEMRLKEKEL